MSKNLDDREDQGVGDVSLQEPCFFVLITYGLVVLAEAARS